ncbi:hypothetical protein [Cryptosporangium minutisporangium]|uniref:HTH cro/C1-type domain-containing protein n=1 Tax=Cryptosporangium minutisporangium TaxID=113569 RepID=A0ABP6TCF9_9ACTN
MTPSSRESSEELGAAIRGRRLELGLTIEQAALAAGVGSESWRRYELGKAIRVDKIRGVCRALRWQSLPALADDVSSAGTGTDTNWERVLEWDVYSPQMAAVHGDPQARIFALGYQLLIEEQLKQDIAALSSRPRGSHLGELGGSAWLDRYLPKRWLTRYDYEFCYQVLAVATAVRNRLAAPKEESVRIARCPLDAIMLYLIVEDGYSAFVFGEGDNPANLVDVGAWLLKLTGKDTNRAYAALYDDAVRVPVGDPWYFDHWFDEFE